MYMYTIHMTYSSAILYLHHSKSFMTVSASKSVKARSPGSLNCSHDPEHNEQQHKREEHLSLKRKENSNRKTIMKENKPTIISVHSMCIDVQCAYFLVAHENSAILICLRKCCHDRPAKCKRPQPGPSHKQQFRKSKRKRWVKLVKLVKLVKAKNSNGFKRLTKPRASVKSTAPMGNPPASGFAKVIKSGRTPESS